MKFKYTLHNFEQKEVVDYIMSMESEKTKLKMIKKNMVEKSIREQSEYDITIQDTGIYCNDLRILNDFNQCTNIVVLESVVRVEFDKYMNINIPIRMFKTREDREFFITAIEAYVQENKELAIASEAEKDVESFDLSKVLDLKTVYTRCFYKLICNMRFREVQDGTSVWIVILSFLAMSVWLAFGTKEVMIYGLQVPNINSYLVIGVLVCAFEFIMIKVLAKDKFGVIKKKDIKDKFLVRVILDSRNLTVIEDGVERVYSLENLYDFAKANEYYKVYAKRDEKLEVVYISISNLTKLEKSELEYRINSIVKHNQKQEVTKKQIKKLTIIKRYLAIGALVALVGVIATPYSTRYIIKNHMPETYKQIIQQKNINIQHEKIEDALNNFSSIGL